MSINLEDCYSLADVANLTGLSTGVITSLRKDNRYGITKIPYYKHPSFRTTCFYPKTEIHEWAKANVKAIRKVTGADQTETPMTETIERKEAMSEIMSLLTTILQEVRKLNQTNLNEFSEYITDPAELGAYLERIDLCKRRTSDQDSLEKLDGIREYADRRNRISIKQAQLVDAIYRRHVQ